MTDVEMNQNRRPLETQVDRALHASESLEFYARQVAEAHSVSSSLRPRRYLLADLGRQRAFLRTAYDYFREAGEELLAASYAAEWLLDNFYLVERALRLLREDMPEHYYRQLPLLKNSPMAGLPRVYALAHHIVHYTQGSLEREAIERFLHAYQSVTPLAMGEIWALPLMLRLASIENTLRAIARVTDLEAPPIEDAPGDYLAQELSDDLIVGNSIHSLRVLDTVDWETFFDNVSRVEQILRRDPGNIYARMDFETRNQYRRVIEDIARAAGTDEERVAHIAVNLARDAATDEWRQSRNARAVDIGGDGDGHIIDLRRVVAQTSQAHVGYYLLDAGKARLEAELSYRPGAVDRLRRWVHVHPTRVYLGGISLVTLGLLLIMLRYAVAVGAGVGTLIAVILLGLVPAVTVSVNVVNWIVTHTVPPRVLPRLDLRDGIPRRYRTIVVIPSLLTSEGEVKSLVEQLERHYLGNNDPQLYFALLTDLADADQETLPEDEALIAQAEEGIRILNKRYGIAGRGPFYLFHRRRQWNPAEGRWMGWERKRGKLVEFNRLLHGAQDTSYILPDGLPRPLTSIRYVITLDADTVLPRDAAVDLVATIAHPLNRARFDEHNRVYAGYTVLQPRVEIMPTSAGRSLFARIFAGDQGLDLYTRAVSDVYHDLMGEGVYAGKGIYDVAAFERCLEGRVPDNTLLSHDLFEGIHGRAGLVSDVTLIEEYPEHYLAYVRRMHRWIRGDWQIMPWLFRRVPYADGSRGQNDLSTLDRWKILDNLRRSLLWPALVALWVAGWFWLPGSPLFWTLAGVAALAMPVLSELVDQAISGIESGSFSGAGYTLRTVADRQLLMLTFVPFHAAVALDAIVRTLIRMTITHRNMLQWTTAAHTNRIIRRSNSLMIWQEMAVAPLTALVAGGATLFAAPEALPVAAPLLFMWLLSPQIAYRISRPIVRLAPTLTDEERQRLRRLARRTWLFFEEFVGPDDNWLPPDHYQQSPRGVVARRTSPTNIGLMLLASLLAYDLGYLEPNELALRLGYSFDTLERMEKHRGHLLNWYTTHTLEPLPPRYVSTVDSGNMVASLMTLRQGCLEMPDTPVLRWQSWQGLIDTLGMLSEVIDELDDEDTHRPEAVHIQEHIQRLIEYILDYEDHPERWPGLLQDILSTQVPGLEQDLLRFLETGIRADAERLRSLHAWIERVRRHVGTMQHDVSQLMPWPFLLRRSPEWMTADDASMEVRTAWQDLLDVLPQGVSYREIPVVCEAALPRLSALQAVLDADSGPEEALRPARAWCATLANTLETARNTSRRLLNDYARLADRAETLFREMDFEFLFDEQREVFYIGYNVDAGRIDEHHYDLLTSEARTASLVTIARDEISQSHWLHLGRPLTLIQGERALLSWSGTMFEYLMPTMFVRQYDGTLLSQSCRLAVEHQIAYGRSHGVPWGISESGYYRFDAAMNYQYYAFGAPGLGFSRGLGEHMVITPYASFLALGIRPDAVMRNAEHLQQLGMLGRYGFFEAIDFTPSRLPAGQRHAIVQSYMAHHQAMILVPMANYLAKDCIVRRFHADPRVQSVELLLQEQVPQRAPLEQTMLGEPPVVRPDQPQVTAGLWTRPVDPPLPEAHVLSNGRYTLMITSAGAGYSRWRDLDLTRWHNDTTLDDAGTWIYLRDAESGDLWSLAHQPIPGPPDAQEAVFYPHMAEFKRRQHEITSQVDVTVSLEDDVEVRCVRLTNNSDRPRRLMLFSYAEVAIGPHDDDQRHPAFSKLFVESEFVADVNGLLFRRRPRSSSQEPIYMLHLLTTEKDGPFTGAHESDRMRFLGRGGSARRPGVLLDQKGILSGTTGATLDPVMSIGQELSLAPHESVQVAYVTLAGRTRQEALQLAGKYQSWPSIERAFGQSRSRIEIEMRQMGLDTTDIAQIQRLLSAVIYPYQALRAVPATLAGNTRGQPSLWPYAISGDYPILLIDVEKADHVPLVQDALQAYIYWRKRQTKVDLVILNRRESGYSQEFQNQLRRLVRRIGDESWINDRGGIFLLQADQMSPDDLTLLETSARVILKGDKGTLGQQLEALDRRPLRLPAFNPIRSGPAEERPETPPLPRPTDLRYDNGLGGFSADGREYVIYLEPGRWTPAPWVNVVANEELGFLISESGGGYTWAINSGENRLTPWHNDPVSDPSDEALYLRDEETGEIWSPTPLPAREDAPYLVRHGAGYTRFEHHSHGLIQHTRFYIAPDDPVKIVRLRLENTAPWTRRITATFYASWVLYTSHEASQM
ncbi:MAG: glucoamylase family protein, partial [Anaerolineae bacterium]